MKFLFWILALIGAIVTVGWLAHWFIRLAFGLLLVFGPLLLLIGIIGLVFSYLRRSVDRADRTAVRY